MHESQNVFALNAPNKSVIEIADPDEGMSMGNRRFEFSMRSSDETAIDVFFANSTEKNMNLLPPSNNPDNYFYLMNKNEGGITDLYVRPDLSLSSHPNHDGYVCSDCGDGPFKGETGLNRHRNAKHMGKLRSP